MPVQKTDLSKFDNAWYSPGRSILTRSIWYVCNACLLNSYFPFYSFKRSLLRIFGAKVGKGVVLKPRINIKYPWNLTIGDHVWIGENVWIDSLAKVTIGSNSCISQGAILLCGNHNYKKPSFDLIVKDILLEEGVWIGAGSMLGPGAICRSHSVLLAKSFTTGELVRYSVYRGNPAIKVKERLIS